jgi:D-alanyl-D-alanine carboxypeptidase (penicillin-binding protein 5/6)
MIRTRTILFSLLAVPALASAQTISAESATAIDASSGKVLWSHNADEELYPASTTKIMTALLLLEHCQPDEIIIAPADVEKVKESSMNLKPNERVRAKDMVYALMLRSANDGCYAVACHISGSVSKFADLMNDRARQLGCTHTHFDNPNGLNDPLHYTTAHDLALIARQAMQYPAFREIVRTEKVKINRGTNWKDTLMVNHNKILFHDATCDGIKTGWTIPAGHCFVGSANRDGWRVITVVMKSNHWQKDTEGLFNWAYDAYQEKEALAAGSNVGEVKVVGGLQPAVKVDVASDAYALVPKAAAGAITTHLEVPASLNAPIAKNQKIGDLVVRDPDGYEHKVDVLTSEDVPATRSMLIAKKSGDGNMILGAGLLAGAIFIQRRTKKKVSRLTSRSQKV